MKGKHKIHKYRGAVVDYVMDNPMKFFTVNQLADATGTPKENMSGYCKMFYDCFKNDGYVIRKKKDKSQAFMYRFRLEEGHRHFDKDWLNQKFADYDKMMNRKKGKAKRARRKALETSKAAESGKVEQGQKISRKELQEFLEAFAKENRKVQDEAVKLLAEKYLMAKDEIQAMNQRIDRLYHAVAKDVESEVLEIEDGHPQRFDLNINIRLGFMSK